MKRYLVFTLAGVLSVAHAQQGIEPSSMGMDGDHMDHAAHMAQMAKSQREAAVAERGKDVMPFDLTATLHVFTKTAEGGVQKVVARNASDFKQVRLVRTHLKDLRVQFLKGDYSGPSHIHGAHMPGLADLEAAAPGQIAIDYKEVKSGAELSYRTSDPVLVAALHDWFDAQVADHGRDAMAGHGQTR